MLAWNEHDDAQTWCLVNYHKTRISYKVGSADS